MIKWHKLLTSKNFINSYPSLPQVSVSTILFKKYWHYMNFGYQCQVYSIIQAGGKYWKKMCLMLKHVILLFLMLVTFELMVCGIYGKSWSRSLWKLCKMKIISLTNTLIPQDVHLLLHLLQWLRCTKIP